MTNWESPNVWAHTDAIDGNRVRQLAAPATGEGQLVLRDGLLFLENCYGIWSASTVDRPLDRDTVWLQLPLGSTPGPVPLAAKWQVPPRHKPTPPNEVLKTYPAALNLFESEDGSAGLRTPQRGALHAILGYWTTKQMTPANVVMPTGTGKTETMLSTLR